MEGIPAGAFIMRAMCAQFVCAGQKATAGGAMIWQGWITASGSSLAALITSVAALIAALAAWRRAGKPPQ